MQSCSMVVEPEQHCGPITSEEILQPAKEGGSEKNAGGQGNGNEEGQKKKRKRNAKYQEHQLLRTVTHYDLRRYESAEQSPAVCVQSFSLLQALSENLSLPAIDDDSVAWTLWGDDAPRVATDRDHIPVLYHFPRFVMDPHLALCSSACTKATEGEVTLGLGEYLKESYVFIDGENSGQLDFATAIPHENGKLLISQSLCDGFGPLTEFMAETKLLSQRINSLIELIDPNFYAGLERVRAVINKTPSTFSFTGFDPILMEARSLTFNQRTPLHLNSEDLKTGWRVLVSLGSFTEGGYVRIPHLGLRLRFLPGDALVLRGSVLEQEVEAWSGGRRICLEYYTQDSIWKYANVEL